MGVVTAVAIGAAATAAAGAYAASEQKKAADKGASAQKKAITSQNKLLKKLDPDALNSLAMKFDSSRAKNRLALQAEIDPEVAQIRELSKKALLDRAAVSTDQRESNQLATRLFNETKDEDPRLVALKDSILAKAQSELAAGASLPPEFQSELVRAGLETGAQSGIGMGKNAVGGGVARLLGAAGIQLDRERTQTAVALTDAAQDLTNSRINILSSVFPRLRELEAADRNEQVANLQLAEAMLPESGISGQEAVNIQIGKSKAKAALLQQRANVKAGEAQANAQFNSSLASTAASAISTGAGMYGAYAGGAGAAAGGAGGGGYGVSYNQAAQMTPQNMNTVPVGGNNFQQNAWSYLNSYGR